MKKILKITTGCILLFILLNIFAVTAYAQDTFSFECKDVTASTTAQGFFVILEEPLIAKEDAKANKNMRLCFRVCAKKTDKGKRACEIKSKCEGGGDIKGDFTCKRIQVIEAEEGRTLLYTYIGMIYKWAAGVIGIVSVLTIVYSGVMISMAGGDSGKIDKAKERIIQSLFGLVVLFLSGLILYTINPTFFV